MFLQLFPFSSEYGQTDIRQFEFFLHRGGRGETCGEIHGVTFCELFIVGQTDQSLVDLCGTFRISQQFLHDIQGGDVATKVLSCFAL